MELPMSPKTRRDHHAALLRDALTARDMTPAGWLAEQIPEGGQIQYDDVRNRLQRLVPIGQRHAAAADVVLTEALGDLYGRVHVAQPGGAATWLVDGPAPDSPVGGPSEPPPAGVDGWAGIRAEVTAEARPSAPAVDRWRLRGMVSRRRAAKDPEVLLEGLSADLVPTSMTRLPNGSLVVRAKRNGK